MLNNRQTYIASKIANLAAPSAPTDAGADRSIRIGSDGLLYWKTPGGNWVRQNGSIWIPVAPPPPSVPNPVFFLDSSTFDNGAGTWTDTIDNTKVYTRDGAGVTKSGNYVSFASSNILDGAAGKVPSILAGEDFSFGAWLKTSDTSNTRFFDMGAANGPQNGAIGAYLGTWGNKDFSLFYVPNGEGTRYAVNNTIQTPENSWIFLAATVKRGVDTIKLYMNGSQISTPYTQVNSSSSGAIGLVSNTLRIGGAWSEPYNRFTGLLGHIKVWNVELTPTEIANEYSTYSSYFV